MAPSFVAPEEDADGKSNVDTTYENFVAVAVSVDAIQSLHLAPVLNTQAKDSAQYRIEACPSTRFSVRGKQGESSSIPYRKNRGRSASHKGMKCSEITISGRWTTTEHNAFLRGLKIFGREWKKVATCIPTRTSAQIRSHAQKYFQSKEMQQFNTSDDYHPTPFQHGTSSKSDEHVEDHTMYEPFSEVFQSIVSDPASIETRVRATLVSLRERYKALEERLQLVRIPPFCDLQNQSVNAAVGPATAALEQEQKSLRISAEARYEMKKRQLQRDKQQATPKVEAATSCALVSLSSMTSYGGFDSNDVIALSMLGGNLCKESIARNSVSPRSGHE